MAFTEVASLEADATTALGNKKGKKDNPNQVEGYYLGSKKVESKKAKSGYAYLHILQTDAGNLGVWGKTNMDKKVLAVTPGTMVRITHTGMQATPNGEMYVFKVEIDSDNTIEVNTASVAEQEEPALTEDGNEDNNGEEEQEEAEEAPAKKQSTGSAAERAARVQALLGKKK